MKLAKKKAIITGGTSGIGLAIAKEFISEGAKVGVFSRTQKSLNQAKSELGEGHTIFTQADVSSISELEKAYSFFTNQLGKIDILVVNAGILKVTPLKQTDESAFDELININLKGAFFAVQKIIPFMNPKGSIVIIASNSGHQGCADFSVYNATKAALISLTQSFAADLLMDQIRVNSISPGYIRTSIQDSLGITEEMISACEKSIPLKHFGKPEDIAKAALFLASDDSKYMTGSDLVIDGGLLHIAPPF